ncbi:MAG TPA: RHS repeat-associated core domain-containing protein [Polyangiaceae bacterium]|nr:RHS repeat-associated core domain-containing protein [Polyangiaceae bacterium]
MLAGTHESQYDYDGQSRRVRITEKENNVQTKQETFIWCGSRICQKRSGTTVLRSYFMNGFEENASSDYFYTRDHLGSVREVVASDVTTVASRLSYDPWGKLTETGTVLSDFTYTGHYYDRSSGLALAWLRGYDPNLGRWLSQDPIGLRGGWNLYGYVENDPTRRADPTGEFGVALPVVVVAGAIVVTGVAIWAILEGNQKALDQLVAMSATFPDGSLFQILTNVERSGTKLGKRAFK